MMCMWNPEDKKVDVMARTAFFSIGAPQHARLLVLTGYFDPSPLTLQDKRNEADPLYVRAIQIMEDTLRPNHPELATMLSNRALRLKEQVRKPKKPRGNVLICTAQGTTLCVRLNATVGC